MNRTEYVVDQGGQRLDLYLARRGPGLSRSEVRRLTEEGHLLLNGMPSKPGRVVRRGDRISLAVPPPRPVDIAPEPMALAVVYQDGELLVVDKPAGLTVHPGPGHPAHTLVNGLLALCSDLKGVGGEMRPGIVHRLDKDTSGLMVVAKGSRAHRDLSEQLKDRVVRKGYLALATGRVEPAEGRIEAPIGRDPRNRKRMAVVEGGREASTRYKVLESPGERSFVEVSPETGRTHQIRVHFASIGHPLVGDTLYGKANPALGRQFLHAHLLGFHHPGTGEYMEFTSPLPEELEAALRSLT